MVELVTEDLGLILPVHAADGGGLKKGAGAVDERFVLSRGGAPVGFKALSGISFHLKEGDRLGIVGRNGAGKSTLLRVLGKIYDPSTGKLFIEGSIRGIFNLTLGLKENSTGYKNIELLGLVAGLNKKQIAEILPGIAEFTELGEFLNMPVHTYSAGMRMRLLFGTVTALRPDILLLDEWLGTGDIKFKRKASQRMAEMVKDAAILVLASHNLRLLTENCNVGIWLDRGAIRKAGPIQEVVDAYTEAQDVEKKEAMAEPVVTESEYE